LIVTARKLANASPGKPRQADLKRAISAAYYALFYAVAYDAANVFVGVGADRPDKAWAHIVRSMQHRDARDACRAIRKYSFCQDIQQCADSFVQLQHLRHDADYDPHLRVLRAEALEAIRIAEVAIRSLKSAPRKDRKAFAVLLLLKKR
jgi:uncharacterized protein (UPF0332 family)